MSTDEKIWTCDCGASIRCNGVTPVARSTYFAHKKALKEKQELQLAANNSVGSLDQLQNTQVRSKELCPLLH